jgi:hypothetical protein
MHNALPFISLLACPLGMAAMGGVAWVWARAKGLRRVHKRSSAH